MPKKKKNNDTTTIKAAYIGLFATLSATIIIVMSNIYLKDTTSRETVETNVFLVKDTISEKVKTLPYKNIITTSKSKLPLEKDTIDRVGIMPFAFYSKDDKLSYLQFSFPENLNSSLSEIPNIEMVEILQREKIFNEIDFQQTDYFSKENAVKLGKQYGASIVVMGSVTINTDVIVINSRMVYVATGRVIKSSIISIEGSLDSIWSLQDNFSQEVLENLNKA